MAVDLTTALYLLAAALVAVAVRLFDSPKTTIVVDGQIQWGNLIPVVAGAIIAVPLGAWILGLNVLDPKGFVELVAVGIAGLSAVKAFLNIATKSEE